MFFFRTDRERYLAAVGHHQGDDHGYMTAKLSIYPLLTLLVFWLTVSIQSLSVTAFVSVSITVIPFKLKSLSMDFALLIF